MKQGQYMSEIEFSCCGFEDASPETQAAIIHVVKSIHEMTAEELNIERVKIHPWKLKSVTPFYKEEECGHWVWNWEFEVRFRWHKRSQYHSWRGFSCGPFQCWQLKLTFEI